MNTEIAIQSKPAQFDLSPKTFEQALTFANYLADSELVPKDFKGKPGNCLVAIQWGMEIGLKPMQALQNIAVINGRPALWGDSVIALVRSSPACEYIIETQTDDAATCKVKRRGEPEQERTFSKKDAHAAGLTGKQGPWTQYPKRMMQMRARAFALRDVFPDVLKGLPVAEEVMDTPMDMGPADVVKPASPAVPVELQQTAKEAAAKGVAAYQTFWAAAGADNRKLLADLHPAMKQQAIDADRSRTVDTPAPAAPASVASATADQAQPAVTYAGVMDKLLAAKNLDALFVAADWIGEVENEIHRAELTEKFEELQAKFGG